MKPGDNIHDSWKTGILTTVRNSVIGDFTQWNDKAELEKALNELMAAFTAPAHSSYTLIICWRIRVWSAPLT